MNFVPSFPEFRENFDVEHLASKRFLYKWVVSFSIRLEMNDVQSVKQGDKTPLATENFGLFE